MSNKGFTDLQTNIETPNDDSATEKPLKTNLTIKKRVDINVLKSKLQQIEKKEFKKNIYTLLFLALALGVLGVYLSL